MRIASLPKAERERQLRALFTPKELPNLPWTWRFWARPEQLWPSDLRSVGAWRIWLVLAGRGWGKTRTGAEAVRDRVESGKAKRIALVARTPADYRQVMVEGESGLIAISPPWNKPKFEPSKRQLTWPNGAIATCYSAEKPDQLRGPQHDFAWADELAAWKYPDAWHQLKFGLRLGDDPRIVVTTTPRPTKIIREIIQDRTTHVTRGSTYDNAANLAPSFLADVVGRYEGTRLGRQELEAEILDDAPGALWKRDLLDRYRVPGFGAAEHSPERIIEALQIRVVVVSIDPAITSGENANETGIIVSGTAENGHGYVLEDVSGHYTPNEWGRTSLFAYQRWRANRIVAEKNQGGELVESNITTVSRDLGIVAHVSTVHAAKGKRTRAEPVAALYEQGRVHHVGVLAELEDQQCTWEPDVVIDDGPKKRVQKSDSPDRLDAGVWGLTDLMIDRNPMPIPSVFVVGDTQGFEDRALGD